MKNNFYKSIDELNHKSKKIYNWITPNYYQYLGSKIWKKRKQLYFYEFLIRSIITGPCPECGKYYKKNNFHLHHKTYIRLGWEEAEDLQLICKKCHALKHNK